MSMQSTKDLVTKMRKSTRTGRLKEFGRIDVTQLVNECAACGVQASRPKSLAVADVMPLVDALDRQIADAESVATPFDLPPEVDPLAPPVEAEDAVTAGTPVGELKLPINIVRRLVDRGLETVADVQKYIADGEDLTKLPGINRKSAEKVRDAVASVTGGVEDKAPVDDPAAVEPTEEDEPVPSPKDEAPVEASK